MSPPSKMFIRKSQTKDIEQIIDIGDETNLSIWTAADYNEEFIRPDALCLTLLDEFNSAIGFLHGRFGISAISEKNVFDLHNIAIRKQFWGKGFGSYLLERLITECREVETFQIQLNVRVSNHSAISFYKKHKFSTVSVVKTSYSSPQEDGLLMSRHL